MTVRRQLARWLQRRAPEPEPEPEPGLDEFEQFGRDHVLLWVGVWPRALDRPSPAAVQAVERALRAMPEFHDLTVVGDPISPRFDVWLRRERPGDDDMLYMDRVSETLRPFWDSDEVGVEVEFGDW